MVLLGIMAMLLVVLVVNINNSGINANIIATGINSNIIATLTDPTCGHGRSAQHPPDVPSRSTLLPL